MNIRGFVKREDEGKKRKARKKTKYHNCIYKDYDDT
jgi:hypothetical protein